MKYSRDELSAMSVNRLRGIDVQTKEEEDMIQEILDIKLKNLPPETPIYTGDISTDNMTPEKEAEMQKKIDERVAKAKGVTTDDLIKEAEEKLDEIKEEINDQEQIIEEKTEESNEEVKETEVKPFCEFCDSRGVRHKSNCTRVK